MQQTWGYDPARENHLCTEPGTRQSPCACNYGGMSGKQKIMVDGEMFIVTRRGRGIYNYEWVSGPNFGYGFSSASHPAADRADEEHRESVRDFLTEIDPDTGYLRDT